MNQNLTELVFLLDRSGSMWGLVRDTIGGFNSMVEKQKGESGQALVSTVLFDHEIKVLHDRVPLEQVKPLTRKEYFARGRTALLDAVGETIHKLHVIHQYGRPEDVPQRTLVVITTDGMENASRQYSVQQVKPMIQQGQEQFGWEFLFLGANMDVLETAGQMGIPSDRAVQYHSDSESTRLNYEVVCRAVSCVRNSEPLDENWKDPIDELFARFSKQSK